MSILKELHTKLTNKYSDMSFKLDDDLISSAYHTGFLIFRVVSNSKAQGIFIEYVLTCDENKEIELLQRLNEINSKFDIKATLNKNLISFSPIYIPWFIGSADTEAAMISFSHLKYTMSRIEEEGYIDKIKEFLK